jgi:hypothetical protein
VSCAEWAIGKEAAGMAGMRKVTDMAGVRQYGGDAIVFAAVLLLALTLIVTLLPPPDVKSARNAAAILTLITAGAVAIERIIEALWTVVGANGRPWWPFTEVGTRVDELVKALNANLEPLQNEAESVLGAARKSPEMAAHFPNLHQAQWLHDTLADLGPSNRRARDLAQAASISARWFRRTHADQDIKLAASRAASTANTLTNFLDTFNDNPARRLISILLGCILGLIGAGALGLDALQATLGTTPFLNVGTAITGIVMGLGSNPTHELIKTLQETKQRRRTA